MITVNIEAMKVICDGLAASLAFVAGILWMFASWHPVATPEHRTFADPGSFGKTTREQAQKIYRGAHLNKWAAFTTGLAALASCASWTIQFFIGNCPH